MIFAAQADPLSAAAFEALKQSPSVIAALFLIIGFIRYISGRDKNDQEERKSVRESQDKLADSVNKLAIVIEGVKEKIKK
jgi:hypothetical protein